MKKNIFLILVLGLILPKFSFGDFLSDPTWLDLYKKIDSWVYDLELKYLDKELRWWDMWWNIVDDLNKRAKNAWLNDTCFKWNLSVKDIKDIYNDNNSAEILSNVLKDCFDPEEASIWTTTFNNYLNIVNESYEENSKKAQTKVDNIYKIWRIWMYSDWVEENSPFDLQIDLQEINSIIFEEQIKYNWVNSTNLWRDVNNLLSWKNLNSKTNLVIEDWNNWVCNLNDSWLSLDSLNNVFWNINSPEETQNKKTWYQKVNDNAFWPCNNFFCIAINFVTYNHNLLGWWTNLSIEWLLKRSNTHFKKFASTSLIQAKMTTNHFELWLKDLQLPEIFHVWVQVSYKPVPLMNVDKKNKNKDEDDFKAKNLLDRYYRNFWLDYDRANDLHIFAQKENELKSILDSQELTIVDASEKKWDFQSYIETTKKENDYVSNTVVNKKVLEEDMNDFYNQFIELESFTNAFLDYAIWVKWVVWKMNQIPQGWKN